MKRFNITGVCIPNKHYMVDIKDKLEKITEYVDNGEYFTINRARQFGKTTTMFLLADYLKDKYFVIEISFEGLGDSPFRDEKNFCRSFISLIDTRLKQVVTENKVIKVGDSQEEVNTLEILSKRITSLIDNIGKDVVLMIDEVDKSSNNQLFLHFLGMLRNKYIDRDKGYDNTFKSVILAGVHDVKNLKLRLRQDEERKFNSPWNIATEFDVDMSFNSKEIGSMLLDYSNDKKIEMDIEGISKGIYKYTNGYPFLVSKICKLIDERLDKDWTDRGIEAAINLLINEKNTLFDDLIKNVENNKDIYLVIYNLLIENETMQFNIHAYEKGIMYGVFKNNNGKLAIHNKIFEIVLYNYLIAKKHIEEIGRKLSNYTSMGLYENEDGTLDIKRALIKYQEYMKSVYSKFDKDFVERQGRLLLLAFFKPVINGKGFYFVESQTGFEQRQDVVITYGNKKYIIELKVWRGEEYHLKGLVQLNGYMEFENADEGYLVIYNKNEEKEYISKDIKLEDKEVFAIWV